MSIVRIQDRIFVKINRKDVTKIKKIKTAYIIVALSSILLTSCNFSHLPQVKDTTSSSSVMDTPVPDTSARFDTSTVTTTEAPVDGVTYQLISFANITPITITMKQSWNALGMDNKERIYIGFTSDRTDGREDFTVFRYDPSNGERLFLGTFLNVSKTFNNLLPGEEIPKGHTHMPFIDGKMYMGSQGFHDFKEGIETLSNYRGSHLYTYDIATGRMEDISKANPGGVITEHQGIIALSYMPWYDLLVGLTHPQSDIVLFNYKENRVEKVVPGIPWKLGNPLSREVVVTRNGKIYTLRGARKRTQRNEINNVWVYDVNTDVMQMTDYTMTGGYWNGQTKTRDGNKIYLSTVRGEIYELDVETEVFKHLGHFLPEQNYNDGERINYLYGITLSPDEKKIFGIPSRTNRGNSGNLYEYDITTRNVALKANLGTGIYTGSDLRDSRGNIYIARFGVERGWEGNCFLLVINGGGQ